MEGPAKSAQMDYCVEVMARLNLQRQHENFCDVSIMVEGREFKAHRSVLSAASPYFDSMFTCNMKEKGQDSVCLEDIGVSAMESVLNFMYTGDVQINQANAHDLMATANYLLLPRLKSRALVFLQQNLDISNCVKTYYFAVKYECRDLLCSARQFINSNFISVCETDEFLALTHDQVKEWFSSDDVNIGAERDVFKVVLKWIGNDESGERENSFPELFRSIRLTCVSRDYFFTDIIKNRLVRGNPECLDVVLDAAKEMAHGSSEYLPRQKPRKCLEKCVDGIVICGKPQDTLCFLPSQGCWYRLAPRVTKYYRVSSCRGCLYTSAECYQPQFDSWSAIASMPQGTVGAAVVALLGYLYLIGGRNLSGTQRLDNTHRYDPDSSSWQKVAPLSSPRYGICAVADGKFIYAIGGVGSINAADRFDPTANTWTPLASMTEPRAYACGVFLRKNIFVFGGRPYPGVMKLRSCEKYSCVTDQWQVISSMQVPRSSFSAVAFGDTIFVFGGLTTNSVQEKTFESYNPESNEWKHKGPLPISLGCCSAVALRLCRTILESLKPL